MDWSAWICSVYSLRGAQTFLRYNLQAPFCDNSVFRVSTLYYSTCVVNNHYAILFLLASNILCSSFQFQLNSTYHSTALPFAQLSSQHPRDSFLKMLQPVKNSVPHKGANKENLKKT